MSKDISGFALNISAVERDTGLSKDVLRMWERRYGFPKPGRDDNGERQYSTADVGKLRAMKRLMDVGLRPGKIIALSLSELNSMADARAPARRDDLAPSLERDIITMLLTHDVAALQSALTSLLMRQGLTRFVLDTVTPLNRAVGDAWMRGELQVFEEHLYTEQLQVALRAAINAFPRQTGMPRMLLTTFPAEHHGLGLLMVEAIMVPEGAQCISLGPQTPLEDIRRAAIAHKAHIVALSFSAAFPLRQATDGLSTLRRELPAPVTLWAGGEMTRRVRKTLPGVVLIPDLASTIAALRSWRTHRVPSVSEAPLSMLYPDLFKAFEAVRWRLDEDVPWHEFDASLLSDEQAQTVKMNAITEWAALPATEMFLRDNRQDSDFCAFMSIWFYEEQKHALALMEYLRRFRPDLVPTEDELHAVRFEFDAAPPAETLMLHFCGEVRLNHWYRCAAQWHSEPVIRKIYDLVSRDEARHAGAYLKFMKRAVERGGDEVKRAFARIGVLMASAARIRKPLHPTNLHVSKLSFPNDTVQSRLPDPTWLERWLDDQIRFDTDVEQRVVGMTLTNLSILFGETFDTVQDLSRYRKALERA